MADYTKVNLRQVPDLAPGFGIEGVEARFGREALELGRHGVTLFRMQPGFRTPFGHRHTVQEEVYVLLTGSGRLKIEDEIVELAPFDAVRVPAEATRCLEAGPDGAEVLVTGAPSTGEQDGEMVPGFWTD
jgi:mannose-6-phosphate isomerase-like protein (cupin superfamily)